MNKEKIIKHQAKKREKPIPREPKWYEKCMDEGVFESRTGKDGKVYGHYNEWKETIWIGPYKDDDELNKVIASYIKETKKPFGKRKEIKNIHSVIVENDKFWKDV